MIRTKAQKQELVTKLAKRLQGAATIYVTDFTGLDVAQITQLRRRLRAAGADYAVVKNSLARRALDTAQVGGIATHVDGPTALVLGGADPVGPAKVLADFAKEFQKPSVRAGVVDGKGVTPEQVKQLAALPPKPELMAQLAGALQSPLAGFVGSLNGLMWNMLSVLESLHGKRASDAAN
jgi:large subunit ribosomal protein L10